PAKALLYEGLAYEAYLVNQLDEALSARRDALALWQERGEAPRIGENLRWLSRVSWCLGKNAESERYAREALAVLEAAPPSRQLGWACSNYAQLHMVAQRATEAVRWGERARSLAAELGDRELMAHALNNVGSARCQVEEGDAGYEMLRRSLALSLE